VKSERYGLANERDMSDENDGLNMEDYYEDYGDDDVDAETENDARRADANPRAGWQGSVHVRHPNIGFRVSKKWRK